MFKLKTKRIIKKDGKYWCQVRKWRSFPWQTWMYITKDFDIYYNAWPLHGFVRYEDAVEHMAKYLEYHAGGTEVMWSE